MKYVIYCAHTSQGDIINMTHNPYLDYEFFHKTNELYGFEVLTPDLTISQANYVIRAMGKERGPVEYLLMRSIKSSGSIKIEQMKKALWNLDLKPLRKSRRIQGGEALPGGASLDAVYNLLRGRVSGSMELNSMVRNESLFLQDDLYDILQHLYLLGKISILPSIWIEKPGRKYICRHCERELVIDYRSMDTVCPCCGSYSEFEEPLFACSSDEKKYGRISVKYKACKSLSLYQDRAFTELCLFLKDGREECLLWAVPGAEDANITSGIIREVLNSGGRVGISVPCHQDGLKYLSAVKEAFPNTNCDFFNISKFEEEKDIVIFKSPDIRRYYKIFDLIILKESPLSSGIEGSFNNLLVKRALREKGKVVHATCAPDYRLYSRALKEDVKLVPVPLRKQGRPSPEPRIMTYKALSRDYCFIPPGALDFILWSVNDNVKVHLIVPDDSLIESLKSGLLSSGEIKGEWIQGKDPRIIITTLNESYTDMEDEENVLIFLADDREIFNERTLLYGAGFARRNEGCSIGEVIFIGSKETEEMYNAKLMLRFLNKSAWEMGYMR